MTKPQLITLDMETYYDSEYSLTKMTTEQYIRDPRFEIIGVSYKIGDAPAKWVSLTYAGSLRQAPRTVEGPLCSLPPHGIRRGHPRLAAWHPPQVLVRYVVHVEAGKPDDCGR